MDPGNNSADDHDNAAFTEALKFAQSGHTVLHLLRVVFEPLATLTEVLSPEQCESIVNSKLNEAENTLKKQCDYVQKQGIRCDHTVVWHRHFPEAIEDSVKSLTPDLIIKQISADTSNPLAMPLDRHLLRFCEAPMLFLDKKRPLEGPIIAAVDPTTDEPVHRHLNASVLQCCDMLEQHMDSATHVVSAFVDCTAYAALDDLTANRDTLKNDIYRWHLNKLKDVLKNYKIEESRIHLLPGEPEVQIPECAGQLDAQMVVIGTAGKQTQQNFYACNTAERILSQLNCHVLALPPGQLSHIEALYQA